MKKAIKLTLAVVLVMGATSLFAQKFGRINTQEIIMAMPETKTMQENMDTFAKELSDNIETMNVEFNTKLQDFQKNYNTFSDAIKEVKEKELNDMQTRTREFQERAQQDYQKKQNELLAPIIDKAKSAIDKVAAAGGFLVVFDTSTGSLAYFDEATLTDVAPAVKKELGITVVYVTHDQGEAMAMSDRVVVMSAGVVQQIGAPHEIYTKPANKMVADFIGLVNFIDGEVKGDRVFIKGSNVSFPNTAKVTGEATIAVRPENITMSLSGGQMEGQVTHRFYLGDAVDYRVNVHGHDIRVIVKGADLDAIPDGSKVYLDFDRVMVFDRN